MKHFETINDTLQALMNQINANEATSNMRHNDQTDLLEKFTEYLKSVDENVKKVMQQTAELDKRTRDIHSVMHDMKCEVYKGQYEMSAAMAQLRDEIADGLTSMNPDIVTALREGAIVGKDSITTLTQSVDVLMKKLSDVPHNGDQHVLEVKQLLSNISESFVSNNNLENNHGDKVMASGDLVLIIELLKDLKTEMSDMKSKMSEMQLTMIDIKFACGKQIEILSTLICGRYNAPALPLIVPVDATTTLSKLKSVFEVMCVYMLLFISTM
jgi:uncharacterized protein YPO0396